MQTDFKKAKTYRYIGNAVSIMAYSILAVGIIGLFTIPLLGIFMIVPSILIYLVLLPVAESLKRASRRFSDEAEIIDNALIQKRKREKLYLKILGAFIVFVIVAMFILATISSKGVRIL